MRRKWTVAVLTLCALPLLSLGVWLRPDPNPAGATFPGANGKIAFTSGGDIFTMDPNGTNVTQLTTDPENSYWPAWSTGAKIAFISKRDGADEIYVMNADGSGQTRLTTGGAYEFPAWSPDGSKIAFSRQTVKHEIYVMNADGSAQEKVTDAPAFGDFAPAWSPDGSKIAFYAFRQENPPGTGRWGPDIYVMNADGSGQTALTSDEALDYYPTWSPDGSKIAFIKNEGGSWAIYVMNPDGSGLTRLSDDGFNHYLAAWSPDGSKIVSSCSLTSYPLICVTNADGSGTLPIMSGSLGSTAAWQPVTGEPTATPNPTNTPIATPPPAPPTPTPDPTDSDGDGCSDQQELGPDEVFGGRRDPFYVWDFMDQFTGVPASRDGLIAVGDLGALVARFGTSGDPDADPLLTPASATGYHTSADRSGSIPGQDPWDLMPPDGNIAVGDIGAAVAQFGHRCA